MRKKLIAFLLVLSMAAALLATFRVEAAETGGAKSYETITWPHIIPVYSQTGGTAFVLNAAFVDFARKHMPGVSFVSEGTSGTFEIMNLLEERANNGRAAISFSSADGVYMSRLGLGLFETPLTEVYQASLLHANETWLNATVSSGLSSIEDVRGRRIGVGPPGSAISLLSEAYVNAYGITFDDFTPVYVGFEGANTGMLEGSLDGGFYGGTPPFAVYEDIASTIDMTALGISQEKSDLLLELHPYFGRAVVPGGVMTGVPEDIIVHQLMTMINMNSVISEELAYAILEMLFDNLEEFRTYAPRALAGFTLENWHRAICSELHPGAIKFFTEKGVFDLYVP